MSVSPGSLIKREVRIGRSVRPRSQGGTFHNTSFAQTVVAAVAAPAPTTDSPKSRRPYTTPVTRREIDGQERDGKPVKSAYSKSPRLDPQHTRSTAAWGSDGIPTTSSMTMLPAETPTGYRSDPNIRQLRNEMKEYDDDPVEEVITDDSACSDADSSSEVATKSDHDREPSESVHSEEDETRYHYSDEDDFEEETKVTPTAPAAQKAHKAPDIRSDEDDRSASPSPSPAEKPVMKKVRVLTGNRSTQRRTDDKQQLSTAAPKSSILSRKHANGTRSGSISNADSQQSSSSAPRANAGSPVASAKPSGSTVRFEAPPQSGKGSSKPPTKDSPQRKLSIGPSSSDLTSGSSSASSALPNKKSPSTEPSSNKASAAAAAKSSVSSVVAQSASNNKGAASSPPATPQTLTPTSTNSSPQPTPTSLAPTPPVMSSPRDNGLPPSPRPKDKHLRQQEAASALIADSDSAIRQSVTSNSTSDLGGSASSSVMSPNTKDANGRSLSRTTNTSDRPIGPMYFKNGVSKGVDKRIPIGRGSFGTVYRGFNSNNGEVIAYKEIPLMSTGDDLKRQCQAIKREIDLMKLLDHPNIVRYLGAEREGSNLLIYMEYIPNGSVTSLIKQYGALKERVAKQYAIQVLAGLNYLHSKNIVHRDIKGDNILVHIDGALKLADFGTSKQLETVTASNTTTGTAWFMAPEVIKNTGHGLASDIWSFGCAMIEMLTGRPPFSELGQFAAMFRIANESPVSQIPLHVSKDCAAMLQRCFAIDPDQRPTALELLNDPWLISDDPEEDADNDNGTPGGTPGGTPRITALNGSPPSTATRHPYDPNNGGTLTMTPASALGTPPRPAKAPSREDQAVDDAAAIAALKPPSALRSPPYPDESPSATNSFNPIQSYVSTHGDRLGGVEF